MPFSGPLLTSLAVGCSWDNFNFTLLERLDSLKNLNIIQKAIRDIFDILSGETDVDHSVCVDYITF